MSSDQQMLLAARAYEPQRYYYIKQLIGSLDENLNVSALIQSWHRVLEQYPVLRSRFHEDSSNQLVQSASHQMKLPVEQQDWCQLSTSEQENRLQDYLQRDRKRGFDFNEALLMRLAVFQLAESDYKLVWTFHPMLLDDQGLLIVLKEVFSVYEAICQNQEYQLPESCPYQDNVTQLHQYLPTQAEAYWRQLLRGFTTPTPLPGFHSQLSVATDSKTWTKSYGVQEVRLSIEATSALQSLAKEHELTLHTIVQGVWALLLSRYSGQEDVVFGTVRDYRPSALDGMESIVGRFTNILPMRVQVEHEMSLLPWLKKLQSQWIALGNYEQTPLVQIQKWGEVPEETSLFESILEFENYPLNCVLQDACWENREFELIKQINSPLTVSGFAYPELLLKIDYDAQHFEQATIVSILEQFQHLLEQVVEHPEERIANISLVTPKAKLLLPNPAQILCPVQAQPQYELVTTLFTDWVNRTPEHLALCQGDRSLTYAQLAQSARDLAQILLTDGVDRGDTVAVFGSRSFGLIASMLGVFLSGGVLLTIDWNLPLQRQQLMLRAAKAKSLLYIGEYRPEDEWLSESLTIIQVDSDTGRAINTPEVAKKPEALSLPELSFDDAAYIFFTSGTTGVPKGVLGCHKGLSHFLTWQRQTFAVGQQDRSAQLTGLSFDVVLRDIFLPLTSGATLFLPALEDYLEPTQILPWLEREQISLLHTVPSLAQTWLLKVSPGISLGSLRWVFFAGEPLQETLIRQWREAFPNSGEIANFYGPTETTLAKFCYQVPRDLLSGVQPVGWPQPETQGLILGKNNQLCGIGEAGEIVIRTPFRSLGYINASEENQRRFVPNPFRDDPQDLLYHTGDRGRYRYDGSLEILGRIDNQVKIRGVRIEPGEIETVLDQHSGVRTTVVIAREDVPGDKRLVAYVVPNQAQIPTITELRSFLKERLPIYMVPSAFVMLEALPLTPNGKIDRRTLPIPETSRKELDGSFVAPRTPTEEILATIWGDILNVEVGIHNNFFELGGHSLLAIQLISRLRDTFSVELPVQFLFDSATVATLAERIDASRHQSQAVPPIQPIDRDGTLSLSSGQARLWFLDQLDGQSPTYNLPIALHLSGLLQVEVLEKAIAEIIRRHEVLRTTFLAVNSSPVQTIAANLTVPLSIVDLQAFPEADRFAEAQRLTTEEVQQPFDLTQGALVRVTLLRLGEEEHVLVVTMHHIVSDGWSMGIVIRELAALYNAFSKGVPSPLPELPIQYADFAHWQRQWLKGEVLETQVNYWKQQLAGAPALLELPTDRPRPAIQSFQGRAEFFQLNAELTQRLKILSQQSGGTLYMTLLAAFATLLSRYSNQENILVGSPIANRNRSETDSLIGFFVNTLVLSTDLQGNPTFSELLRRVRQVALDAYAHQDVPFEQLVEVLNPERNLSYHPLFQVMFVLDNALTKLEVPGLSLTHWDVETKTAKFDLNLLMEETEQGLKGRWEYKTDLFDAATITRMTGHFQTLLEAIATNPEQHILELPLLSEAERHQLLVEWNDTQADYPKDTFLHQLFEAQVEQTPDAVAVKYKDQPWTYRELNARANQIAHHLQALGVGPEVLVGIFVERSLEMIAGLLGILKAGGAYVPLDPNYPKERLADLLSDSQAPVLLTQEKLVTKLPEYEAHVVCLDKDWEVISQQSQENPVSDVRPNNLAYIIYTSGSTGKPKGVAIEHCGAVNTIIDINERFQVGTKDRLLAVCSLNFDLSVYDVFGLLAVGGTIIVPEASLGPNPAHWLELMVKEQVTFWNSAPPVMQLFVSYVANQSNVSLPSLRLVLLSGDWIPVTLPNQLKALSEKVQVISLGGATEASIWSIYYPIETVDATWKSIPYGKPLANQQFYILDSQLQPVPIGVTGELHIGGDGLARCYFNRPELTQERFIPNPLSDTSGTRLYKTGDLGRYLPDGNIEFLGRLDHQVKIRGFRIELGEIETVLTQHPQVRETLIVAREDRPGNKYLVAYVIPQKGQAPTINELRSFLKQTLPDYMVPSAFVMLDLLPLTPNGKIDRKALPIPDQTSQELEKTFVAPRNELERQLTKVWEKVLGIQPIGVRDNFFELGGHSLLAATLWNEIEKVAGKSLPIATLFQSPTIEQLANMFREGGGAPSCSSLMVIQPGGSKPPLFCIHVLGRGLEFYRPMARYMDPEQPMYGLTTEIATLDKKQVPPNRVEDLAAFYIKEMRILQPEGPYHLIGVSFGGEVAFELAQQLLAQGQKVALLVLLDTRTKNAVKYSPSSDRLSVYLRNLSQRGPAYILEKLHEKMKGSQGNLERYCQELQCKFYQSIRHPLPPPLLEFTYRKLNTQASQAYVPQVYPGRVTLFRASKHEFEDRINYSLDPEFGWGDLVTGGLEIHQVSGDHLSMLKEPHVQGLAEKLRDCLSKALAMSTCSSETRV
ncbi:MAG: amino acid adenylation domain-containing protein [Symplocastrum torsivum CPER-KK1]|uniref:Amino acid adenylation domain-containing protein n=1 Tax=Symplocastrum torsivum CPER-KK1 TaxID=450513 RepID=A0A951PTB9_9CYAN|nr:amino acid adenylation domain-containing protein [Symplocastrum torsivum CPER-KK1]